MRKGTQMTLAILAITLLAGVALADTVNFDNFKTGAPPPGWTATKTGSGAAKWTIEQDDSAPSKPNVLKQSGQATYPVCIKDDTSLKDGFVEVKFKPISGKEDQAGGVIWRAKDSNNYYIARANALEDNVTSVPVIVSRCTARDVRCATGFARIRSPAELCLPSILADDGRSRRIPSRLPASVCRRTGSAQARPLRRSSDYPAPLLDEETSLTHFNRNLRRSGQPRSQVRG